MELACVMTWSVRNRALTFTVIADVEACPLKEEGGEQYGQLGKAM